jgi:DNA-binding CsgD family transcriptional regulator
LAELSHHTGAKAANLLVTDQFLPEVQVTQASANLDEKTLARYAAEFAQYEVRAIQEMMKHPPQRWIRAETLIGDKLNQLPSTLWLKRECGIFHRACARLNTNKGWFDAVTVNMAADRGQITAAEAKVGNLFLPHLAKAVEVGRSFQILRARFHAVLGALDRFHMGVLILGPLGHVMLKNQEAQRILELKDGVGLDTAGKPTATDTNASRLLARAVQRALATADAQDNRAETVLSVQRRSERDAFIIEVSPLRGSELSMEGHISGAIVLLVDPAHHALASTQGIKDIYGLTDAEAEVLRLLVAGHDSEEMAEMRGVSLDTVRTQIKRILAKTDTHGRPALVRLALSVNPPIDPAES